MGGDKCGGLCESEDGDSISDTDSCEDEDDEDEDAILASDIWNTDPRFSAVGSLFASLTASLFDEASAAAFGSVGPELLSTFSCEGNSLERTVEKAEVAMGEVDEDREHSAAAALEDSGCLLESFEFCV